MKRRQRLLLSPHQFDGDRVNLNGEQRRYLHKVLRLQSGDQFIAMDGQGHWWNAELTSAETGILREPVIIDHELPISVTLVAAPSKGKGFDEVVHQATELGVRHIYPLLSERTQVRPSEQRLRRWQTIAREATEQSWRQFVPQVHPPVRFEAWLASLEMTHPVWFCSTRPGQASLLQTLGAVSKLPQVTIVTGPEGGWSSEEEAQLVDQKCIGVGLGPRTLRAVTAPVCALSLIAAFLEPSSPEA